MMHTCLNCGLHDQWSIAVYDYTNYKIYQCCICGERYRIFHINISNSSDINELHDLKRKSKHPITRLDIALIRARIQRNNNKPIF